MVDGQIYIGTTQYAQYAPAPASGMTKNNVGYSESMDFDNGGTWIARSVANHASYAMTFPTQDSASSASLEYYSRLSDGEFGTGFIYWNDPMAQDQNLFSVNWAAPGLAERGWKTMLPTSFGTPTFSSTTANTYGLPSRKATYSLLPVGAPAVGAAMTAHTFIIPPDCTLWLGGAGSVTGTGGMFAEANIPAGRFNKAINPSPQDATQTTAGYFSIGTGGISRVANAGVNGFGVRYTATGDTISGTATGVQFGSSTTGAIAVLGGEPFTPSLYVNANLTRSAKLLWQYFDVANAMIGATRIGTITTALVANAPMVRIQEPTETAPNGTTHAIIRVYDPSNGWAGTATNLATNPSFETTTGTVEVQRNLHTNPRGASVAKYTSYAGVSPNANTLSSVSQPLAISGLAFRATWTDATNASGDVGVGALDATAGVSTTMVFKIVASRTQVVSAPQMFATAGVVTTTAVSDAASFTLTAGVPRLIWLTFTPDATSISTGNVHSVVTLGNKLAGDTFDVIDVDMYAGAYDSTRTPFSGATAASGDYTYSWLGAANASGSVQAALGITTVGGGTASGGTHYSSTAWSERGTRSLRITPGYTSNDTYAAPGGDTGAMQLGMVAGNTYTAMATIRLAAPLTGAANPSQRQIIAYYRNSSGTYVPTGSTAAPNVAGVTQLRVTFTIPAGATEAFIRLYNGAPLGGGDVWWDSFMLAPGTYTGPYIDGAVGANLLATNTAEPSTGWTGGAGGTGTGALTYVTGTAIPGTSAAKYTWTAPSTGQWQDTGPSGTAIAGATYSFSMSYLSTWSGGNIRMQVQWTTGSGNVFANVPSSVSVAGTVTRLSGQLTAPANATGWQVFLVGLSGAVFPVAGDSVTFGAVRFTQYTGYVTDDAEYVNPHPIAWTATANASTSTRLGDTMTIDRVSTATGAYFDGNQSGASWTGTPYASTSVTYAIKSQIALALETAAPAFSASFDGAAYKYVRVYIGRADNTISTATVAALWAQIRPTGVTPTLTRHIAGKGASGLQFDGNAIPENYVLVDSTGSTRHLTGMSFTLTEVEQWQ